MNTAQKKKENDPNINDPKDWAKIQKDWARERLQVLQARADYFFTTDEELPLSRHIMLAVMGVFFVLFILWSNLARLDEVTRGQGKVIPSSEVQVLSSLEGGIVDEFLVSEGDSVEAGQPILRLRDIQASSDLGANTQRYLGLKAKMQRLQAEAEGKIAPEFSADVLSGAPASVKEEMESFRANMQNLNSQLQVLETQLSQRRTEINELQTRIRDARGVIALSREEKSMIEPLVERGSAPKVELLQLERGIREREQELNSLQTSVPRVQAAINEAQARINELRSSLKAQAQTELSATNIEMKTIEPTLSALQDRKTRTEMRSPVKGIVKDIKIATVGGVVQPGEGFVEIVPLEDQLLVEAQVRPADIAHIYPGQPAIVKITAYDFSIYGGLNGEVVDISADTIQNQDGESFYRVRVRTPETHLKRHGETLEIIPGMVASVDILTGQKTVMQYLMKPLIKTMNEAMRER